MSIGSQLRMDTIGTRSSELPKTTRHLHNAAAVRPLQRIQATEERGLVEWRVAPHLLAAATQRQHRVQRERKREVRRRAARHLRERTLHVPHCGERAAVHVDEEAVLRTMWPIASS